MHAHPESLLDTVAPHACSADAARATSAAACWSTLAVGALLFMALPAMNLVNLNISRILERASEIGVRKAFGASSWTLVGQFLVENLILTLVGSVRRRRRARPLGLAAHQRQRPHHLRAVAA